MHPYHPTTDEDRRAMLEVIGVSSFESLLQGVPAALRNPGISIDSPLSELEVQNLVRSLGQRNVSAGQALSFLGGGSYEHFVPAAVSEIIGRNEFYTAYTPYQPEASQGSLQAIFEYQSLISELTGLDVSNASHYDGSTSMAEAAVLALRHTDRSRILVSEAVHPHYREVLATYLGGTPYSVETFGCDEQGLFNRGELTEKLSDEVAGVILQTPNFFGVLEDLEGVSDLIHEAGALMILAANPLPLGLLKSPGEWGADIAVGEGQPFGIPTSYGGPYLGYFAVTRSLLRRVPGRLAGLTRDGEGRRAFVLTLQAREQHIRRERASSNICTNQALCALAACVMMTLLGKQGIRELAEINMDRAHYLRARIGSLQGFETDTALPVFNEFVVKSKKPFREIEASLVNKGILPGIALSRYYAGREHEFLVCATETKTRSQLDQFVEALEQC